MLCQKKKKKISLSISQLRNNKEKCNNLKLSSIKEKYKLNKKIYTLKQYIPNPHIKFQLQRCYMLISVR